MSMLMPLALLKSSSKSSIILFLYSMILMPITLSFVMTNKMIMLEWEILTISTTTFTIPLILDPVGIMFSNIVCLISACVMMFTSSYMSADVFLTRFTWLVMLFVMSMNLLIFIPNMMTLLLGWDGLGIVSFALVIYYSNMKSLAAGMLTALANRLGDVMLLLAIGMTATQGHWNIMFMWNTPMSTMVMVTIMLAAMTKSAQIPFSAWLPAAMAAPTPVSALVHSSTLVTAGIFLLIRFYPFLSSHQLFNQMLLLISITTMLMAGVTANYEFDLKKIIALSTLSQLGLMMMSISLGYPSLALFHLFTHALFKAMLFLCAGSIIHNNSNNQDIRNLGALWTQMPLTTACLNVANLALCGAPFLSGFYSKDLILEVSLTNPTNLMMLIMIFIATGMTASYSARLSMYSLWGPLNHKPLHQNKDEDMLMTTPIMILSFMTIPLGELLQSMTLNFNEDINMPMTYKFLVIISITFGVWVSQYFFKLATNSTPPTMSYPHHLNFSMWTLTMFSTQPLIKQPLYMGAKLHNSLDRGWFEILGGQGTMLTTTNLTKVNQMFQVNFLTTMLMISMATLTAYLILKS
uniref:NADH-ubiquinone oxidoreductase chain 5 n=1 Tax=Notocrater youngi TaxID=2813390 RepID=A0A894KA28_9VEST|nr:NADH dehydrogenase subunit 5 [Notocrater youngi]